MKTFLIAMVLMVGVNMSAQVLSSTQALELSKNYLAEFSKGETDYIADGKPVASGEPVRGQTVQQK
jgi:hypothetical protein